MPQTPLILVDGSSYLYRAFHALPPLTNSHGEPTGAIYGVISMLRKLIQDYQPQSMAVIFDAKGKTFRDDLYEKYKANRPVMPDELQAQIEPLHAIIKAFGIPLIMVSGVEADDVIGTLVQQTKKQKIPILISTGDKDLAQLVDERITLINTMTNGKLDPEGVKQKLGVTPAQVIDYLTLVGDSVDNIPGIPGVGPKTAAKWLADYDTLENLIKHAATIKGKVGENLRAHLHQLPLAQQLATIKCDVTLDFTLQDLQRKPADRAQLLEWFKRLEFKGWLKELLETSEQTTSKQSATTQYETILQKSALDKWFKQLQQAKLFSFDTETNSLDPISAELVGLSFAIEPGKAAYVPLAHDYTDAPKQLDRREVLQTLKPLLEDTQKKKLGHNLKFDTSILANYAITLRGIAFDSMLESYVLDSTATRHDMDSLALKYLAHRTITFAEVAGTGQKQLTFNQVAIEQASTYAAEDADIALQLHQHLWERISHYPGLQYILLEIEIPLLTVLSRMERHGVLIQADLLKKQSKQFAKRLQELEEQAYKLAGQVFNLASPKQLQEIFYIKQGLPVLEKTPTGQPSTSESVLQELALNYPLPKIILQYRSLSKLKSTYLDRLPEQIHPKTGRVHTSYHQAAVATGRLSSSEPNLQNIPVRTEEGRRIRQAFIAPPNYKIVAADYSQIELRIMAHLSQDPGLLNAFAQGLDIHKATAAEIFNLSLDKVTAEQRRSAKAINFGLIYGMSAFGLSKQLGIPRQAAQDYIERYFERYPLVRVYMETTRQQAHKQGYVETLFGRRLNLPDINTRNLQRQRAAERAAINAPLQGTAADIIKLAMIKIDAVLQQQHLDAHMIMQVHDELIFEVADQHVAATTQMIRKYMTQIDQLKVPLVVEIGMGNNWDEAH